MTTYQQRILTSLQRKVAELEEELTTWNAIRSNTIESFAKTKSEHQFLQEDLNRFVDTNHHPNRSQLEAFQKRSDLIRDKMDRHRKLFDYVTEYSQIIADKIEAAKAEKELLEKDLAYYEA